MNLEKIDKNNASIIKYSKTDNVLNDICSIIDSAREWYENEALGQTWSVRTLQRNISSQYYYRLLKSQVKEPVIDEMKKVNENQYLMKKLEFVKNPVIADRHILNENGSITRKLRASSKQRLKRHLKTLKKLRDKKIVDDDYVYIRKNAFYNHIKDTKESKKLKVDSFPKKV